MRPNVERNSSIELLKFIAIILVVISHVVQTLCSSNPYVPTQNYVLDISVATTNIQHIALALLRYSGIIGNSLFFVCSAWFLLDSDTASPKKALRMLMDVWVISIIILTSVYFIRNGNISSELIKMSFFPTTYANNWYITCYLLFYSLHPYLNCIIQKMEQRTLLKATLILLFLYVGINFLRYGFFYTSPLILWITIYFAIAYMKYYLVDISDNLKINTIMLAISFLGNTGIVLLTNFLGLHFSAFNHHLLRWCTSCNPFILLMAISLLNIARNIHFKNQIINYISRLSMLIYIIHENILLRTFYRPMLWDYVYNQFGYDSVLAWAFALTLMIFTFGLIASIAYKNTIQNLVSKMCDYLYPNLQKMYGRIEERLLRFH